MPGSPISSPRNPGGKPLAGGHSCHQVSFLFELGTTHNLSGASMEWSPLALARPTVSERSGLRCPMILSTMTLMTTDHHAMAFKRFLSAGRLWLCLSAGTRSPVGFSSSIILDAVCSQCSLAGYSLRTEIYPPAPECIKVPHLPQVHLG